MQRKKLAMFACGGPSTTRQSAPSNEQPSSPAIPAGYACTRRSAEPGGSTASRKAAVVRVATNLLTVLGFLAWRGMNFVAEAAQPPTSNVRQSPSLALARDTKARQIQFRFSPYAESTGPGLVFSEAALRSLAQRLFPARTDELKRQKFFEVAFRIDLSKQILDLTPAHKIQHLRASIEKTTKRLGRHTEQLRNPFVFANAVRSAFHSFVNRQEVKAMAALHLENPELAKQLETVNVTAELRHLIASALPAIQPANPTAEEKAALHNISSFYADLASTRKRLVDEAMKKVDLTTPVDFSHSFEEGTTTVPSPSQVESIVDTAHSEANKRVAEAYQKMAPTEKLDFAAAGLTLGQLSEAVSQRLLENVGSDPAQGKGVSAAARTAIRTAAKGVTEEKDAVKRRAYRRGIALSSVFGVIGVIAYVAARKLLERRPKRRVRGKQAETEETVPDLNLEDLANMPLSALRSRALSKRKNKAIRSALREKGKYRDETDLEFKEHISGDWDTRTENSFVSTKYKYT